MKIDALDHPKTLDFAARLDVSLPTAVGHLEFLWVFTGKKAPQGNVGKWPDGSIARACHWMGPPDRFIQALLDAGLLDGDPTHRLVVHDWSEHAPRWVSAKLKKLDLEFVVQCSEAEEATAGTTTDSSIEGTAEAITRARAFPREGKGREGKSPGGAKAPVLSVSAHQKNGHEPTPHENLPVDAWQEWIELRRSKRWPCDPVTLRKQLKLLAQFDTEVQRRMIDTSINAGWQGIFEPKGQGAATRPHGPRALRPEDLDALKEGGRVREG